MFNARFYVLFFHYFLSFFCFLILALHSKSKRYLYNFIIKNKSTLNPEVIHSVNGNYQAY
jgi:hypothetical protein